MSEPQDIQERSMGYALRIVRLYRCLAKRKNAAGWVSGRQLLRAGTSIGANITEAQAGESRADFAHKYSIARKVARESLCWLRRLLKSEPLPDSKLLINQTNELIAIITKIIVSTERTL